MSGPIRTFAGQDKLKKLPIPDVTDSCRNYLEALQPLQTPKEHEATQEAVKQFLQTSASSLQEELIQYASTRASYIEQFWYDSYLNYDDPVVLNLNPFFLLEDDSTPYQVSQVSRAATLTMSSLRFVRALRREELPPDMVRNEPLCMYQYTQLFGTSRVPTANGCVMQSDCTSKHIVVMARAQFYWFDVLDDNNDLILSERDIAVNFQSIVEDASETPITDMAKGAIGVLTTENRRIWANIRDSMANPDKSAPNFNSESLINGECLDKVDTALFIVCLDHNSPETNEELANNMLCGTSELEKGVQVGTCTNRWYDKLQIIVTKNAKAGVNFEHTGVDGHTVLRFVSDVYTDTILRFAKSINGGSPSLWQSTSPDPTKRDPASFGQVSTTPRKLEWVPTSEISLAVRFGETRLADLIGQTDFAALEFQGYGMDQIKRMGFSPDAFVQMAFQAAYYALYGRVECTYEPSMTKKFLHGRTESIRTVSNESVAFVRKFMEDAPAAQKIEYLKRACEKHVSTTRRAAAGLGQDRHLYALFCIWKRYVDEDGPNGGSSSDSDSGSTAVGTSNQLPAIFADSGWDTLNTTVLSTSNCGNPSLKLFGFGPTSLDGFGIGYIIKADSIVVCVSSKHRQTKRFIDTLNSYFLEVRDAWKATNKARLSIESRARVGEKAKYFGRSVAPPTPLANREEEKSYLLSGYGYFDIGDFDTRSGTHTPVKERRRSQKEIGRKLRLADY